MSEGARQSAVRTLEDVIEQSRHPDPRRRRAAIHELCPCEVKRDSAAAWDRIFEMVDDPDASVRRMVLHTLCDGSPRTREREVLAAVEEFARDPERSVHRIARKVLAQYRRTGRLNVL
ncbi:MAG: HEAT repeat domain-containing protein [Myxococcales bacterium]|nr:HEAT repeat domain-containing protein [Myxococcales bacterium]